MAPLRVCVPWGRAEPAVRPGSATARRLREGEAVGLWKISITGYYSGDVAWSLGARALRRMKSRLAVRRPAGPGLRLDKDLL